MTLNWTGFVSLDENGVNTIKAIPGVYRLGYTGTDGKKYVYYVGQASDLKSRLSQHLSSAEQNSCCSGYVGKGKCYFRAAAISLQEERDAAEVALYKKFAPKCCEQIPDCEPSVINFD